MIWKTILASLVLVGCARNPQLKPTIPEYIEGGFCPYEDKTIVVVLDHGVGNYLACQNFKIQKTGKVSGGKPNGFDTAEGNFKVLRRYKKYNSKKYPQENGYNMRYAQFFNGGFAIHQGNVNAYSHGCVHCKSSDAVWLWGWARIGTSVKVMNKIKYQEKLNESLSI